MTSRVRSPPFILTKKQFPRYPMVHGSSQGKQIGRCFGLAQRSPRLACPVIAVEISSQPRLNPVELTSPQRRPGSRKPHEIWIRASAGMTLVALFNNIAAAPSRSPAKHSANIRVREFELFLTPPSRERFGVYRQICRNLRAVFILRECFAQKKGRVNTH
jgi:hypothetical protein